MNEPDQGQSEGESCSVLMVDDHPANLVALEAILHPLGQRLVRAISGEEALRKLLEQDFAVILMDVQMPGLDGFQTAQLIRQRERSRQIPIIFLTAIHRDPSYIFQGYAHGAVDYLLKPFAPEILRSKVSVFVDLYLKGERIKRQDADLHDRALEALERRNLQQFRDLVDAIPDAIVTTDAAGRIEYCNRSWQAYSGLSLEATRRRGFAEVLHPDDRDRVASAWPRGGGGVHAGGPDAPVEMEYRLRRQDGAYRWHLSRLVPRRDGGGQVVGWVGTITDVDDQKKAREEAVAANRTKDEFLATVSHELRTPLNAILGWVCMLRKGTLDDSKTARALETIERNSRLQAQLIADILDVSRIVSGKLHLDRAPMDLSQVVRDTLEASRPIADAKGVHLALELALPIQPAVGDAARLQQIAWNLLANAIKFTPRGGQVTVRLGLEQGDHVLEVSDTGRGIAPSFLPFVFDRFRQADASTTRTEGGLGLGLAIVRHLVELHGGEVAVTSGGENQGALFTVRIPNADPKCAMIDQEARPAARTGGGAPSSASETSVLRDVRILVVDDDDDARELLRTLFCQQGAEVVAVDSAAAALESMGRVLPNVLVSDIGMPDEDGYSLIRKVRALAPSAGGAVPAVALTGFARAEDGRRARESGFSAHIAKPVDPAALLSLVERFTKG